MLTVDAAAPDVQAVDQMLDFIPSIVEEVDNVHLLRPIELDEVRKAVFGRPSKKDLNICGVGA